MVVVAVVAHLLAGLPWEVAFVLGAALAPTDPVAATSIICRLGAPERVTAILEGESLVNDGTALSALQVALGTVVAATFALGSSTLEFFGVVLGGIAGGGAGGLAGLAGPPIRLDQPEVEIAISVLTGRWRLPGRRPPARLGDPGRGAGRVGDGPALPARDRSRHAHARAGVLAAGPVLRRVDAVPAR